MFQKGKMEKILANKNLSFHHPNLLVGKALSLTKSWVKMQNNAGNINTGCK
jgi:hypothetical protein